MNGTQGIQPVVELATNNNGNGFYPYPVYPMMGGYGNGGFGGYGNDFIWVILLLALFGGNWGNGNGGFFGGNSFDNGYAWLSNGQKDIMNQTSDGFNSLHLSNQIDGVRNDVNDIQNAICNSTASINSNVSNGFYNSEIAACNRQMANMNQSFNNQIATLQGFNGLQKSLDNCCCENRLGIANLNSTILSENCADRAALADGLSTGIPSVLSVQQVNAITVNGVVKDKNGDPIVGATVTEKGNAKNGAITDIDGKYSLRLPAGKIITVSYVGFKTAEFKATSTHHNFSLEEDLTDLNEVVVVGYGTQKKADVTSSVASVKAKDFNTGSVLDAGQLVLLGC